MAGAISCRDPRGSKHRDPSLQTSQTYEIPRCVTSVPIVVIQLLSTPNPAVTVSTPPPQKKTASGFLFGPQVRRVLPKTYLHFKAYHL